MKKKLILSLVLISALAIFIFMGYLKLTNTKISINSNGLSVSTNYEKKVGDLIHIKEETTFNYGNKAPDNREKDTGAKPEKPTKD